MTRKRSQPRKNRQQHSTLRVESLENRDMLALAIDVGTHQLIENTPGQTVDIFVTSEQGDPPVTDFLLRAQIGQPFEQREVPVFDCTAANCETDPTDVNAVPWFKGGGQLWNSRVATIIGGPLYANPPVIPTGFQNVAQATVSIDDPVASYAPDGFIVRLEIDTTGIFAEQNFELRLKDTFVGDDSHFLNDTTRIDPIITNGTLEIIGEVDPPPTVIGVVVNGSFNDPVDLPSGGQPTAWTQQRSDIRSIVVEFSEPVQAFIGDFQLSNLGVNAPVDPDQSIPLIASQMTIVDNRVILSFPPGSEQDLDDGVYQLDVLSSLTDFAGGQLDGNGDGVGGDAYRFVASEQNAFYQLQADANGDGGVSVFDFTTFSYWFGQQVEPNGTAPEYADYNGDGGVSVFDFTFFADNFGLGIVFPAAFATTAAPVFETNNDDDDDTLARQLAEQDDAEVIEFDALLAEWTWIGH